MSAPDVTPRFPLFRLQISVTCEIDVIPTTNNGKPLTGMVLDNDSGLEHAGDETESLLAALGLTPGQSNVAARDERDRNRSDEPTLDQALNDPELFRKFVAPFGEVVAGQ
jgi:hypothetical protein